jgi:hypothetical protein
MTCSTLGNHRLTLSNQALLRQTAAAMRVPCEFKALGRGGRS